MRHGPALLLAIVPAALLVAGCGGSDDAGGQPSADSSTTTAAAPTRQYVALGDSYAAAPGLPPADTASGSCSRSLDNYPHLIAQSDPDLALTDMTCSGATSQDVLDTQEKALSTDTDLVTVGIGGNDGGLFVKTLFGCAQVASSDPDGAPCTGSGPDSGTAKLDAALATIRTDVADVVTSIHRKAPNATVVVIGYPQALPGDGTTCPDLVPLASGDYPLVNRMNSGLSDDLKAAAAKAGDDFVDLYSPSKGHDICSSDPWINGQNTADDGVIPFHPFAAEQQAVAGLVSDLLS